MATAVAGWPAIASGQDSVSGDEEPAAAAPRSDDRRTLARIERPPLGLPPVPLPADNPPTVEKIRLGRKLFLDRRLSSNGTLSCAMCHVPEQAFTQNETRTSVGSEGRSLRRNAPTLVNVAYVRDLFHDGREPSLDLQPFNVFLDDREMAAPSLGAVEAKVRSLDDYDPLFVAAFGGAATVERIGHALGTYARTLLAGDSPFDRWYYGGEASAISPAAERGLELFAGEAGCVTCHTVGEESALFSDGRFHDTGIGWHATMVRSKTTSPVPLEIAPGVRVSLGRAAVRSVGEPPARDLGRYEVTHDPADRWRYRTPSLRNVARTAPYMHDGSISTLRGVVEHYDRGGHPHDGLDPAIRPLGLEQEEIDDLVAFLESLTSSGLDELVADARSEEVGNPGSR